MIAHRSTHEPASLLFNVSQLLKDEVGQTRTYEFRADGALDLGDREATEVEGRAKFTLTNFGIVAHVTASGVLHLTCARCLEPCTAPVHVTFAEEFVPSVDIQTGLPARVPVSDDALPISPNHMIDLGEAIRQQFLLSMELIPLCRPDCRGLCPTCGVNLNTQECGCPPQAPSNPFEVLKDLIPTDEN